ncbi:MAG: restriction endonuclease [Myxococcales bacterium]|nr:restriction endonuclease [Myxococcales bacterium]
MARVLKAEGRASGGVSRGPAERAEVPQADKLESVRQLAAAVGDGIHHPAALLELLHVDQRHFAYYRQAAVLLGLVRARGDRSLALTDLGRRLIAAPEGSADERRVLARAIDDAASLRPLGGCFAADAPVDAGALARRVQALTGLAPSTAARRAQTLIRWREYVLGPDLAPSRPDLPDLSARLERLIARHNALAKQRTLEWLLQVAPGRFETILGELARALGYREVIVRGGPSDGGIDVQAIRLDRWGHRARVAIQAKRYQRPVGRRIIDEMIGVVARERLGEAIVVTTSEFSKQAESAARGEPRLRLVNGAQLVDLLAEHGVVVRYAQRGELVPA